MRRTKQGEFGWIDLSASDIDAQTSFYEALFGWTHRDIPTPQGPDYKMYYLDGAIVAGGAPISPDMAAAGVPTMWNTYVLAEDIDALAARAVELGGQVIMPAMDVMTEGRMVAISDPTGGALFFWQARDHGGAEKFHEPGSLVWNDFNTRDVEAAAAFYKELLGWDYEIFMPGELDYAMIVSGGQMHGGFPSIPEGTPAHWVGNVAVESVDETAGKAKAAGGRILVDPVDFPGVGRYAVIADPQGAVLALFQPAGEGAFGEGVFVWNELVTSDVEAAKRFYGDVFGWTAADMDMGGGFTYTIFKRAGDDTAANRLAGAMPLGDIPAPPHWLSYIAPDDIDATAARAAELGATIMREPWDIEGVGRIAIVQYPTGAVFGLFKFSA
jgi:predicted enzyme related to lactoylglutathione lyase